MIFKVKTHFKSGRFSFEPNNTHDSEILGIADDHVERWYRAGFVDIEGRTPSPDLNPNHTELAASNIGVTAQSKNK